MQNNPIVPEVVDNKALIDIGDMPRTAGEIHDYVKNALILKATPLKEQSLGMFAHYSLLHADWQVWDTEEAGAASALYDMICKQEKDIDAEIDEIINKAHKLHKGMTAARKDIYAGISGDAKNPGLKENLMTSIRAWRKREDDREAAEAKRLADIALKAEEDKRLAEAAELEKEAEKLKASGLTEMAEEVQKEAIAIIEEPIFVPPPVRKAVIPMGGPKRQTFWKFQVIDFAKLPDTFKLANEQMIRATVNAQKSVTNIPGVKVWPE